MNRRTLLGNLLAVGLFSFSTAASKPMIALDCYHNTETPLHYTWQKVNLGGYSQFAQILLGLGADTSTIATPLDSATLAPVTMLIIANPCDSAMVKSPHLIAAAEIDAVDKWVQRGGKLMCFANNTGHVEFVHYNQLVARFGITFNDTTQPGGSNFGPVPQNAVFSACTTFYIVDMCNLSISSPATSIFTFQGGVLMATAVKGKGVVFAMGDPWVYDEHIAAKNNVKGVTQVVNWLLGTATPVLQAAQPSRQPFSNVVNGGHQMVLPNGRMVCGSTHSSPGNASAVKACGIVYVDGASGRVEGQVTGGH
jgi:hypothetical protein